MAHTADSVPDASEQYHLWDELVTLGISTALAVSNDEPEETRAAARERLSRGLAWALKERDEMWMRLLRRTNPRDR